MAQISFKSVGKTSEDVFAEQLSVQRMPVSVVMPLRLASSGTDMFVMYYTLADTIHNNLKNLLQTNRGERLIHTDYGANLLPLASEYVDAESFDIEATQRIKTAVNKWMPFIELDDYVSNIKNDTVSINISYNVPTLNISGKRLQIELNIT
jgi:phage baseplate assembly protein W